MNVVQLNLTSLCYPVYKIWKKQNVHTCT